MKIELNLDTKEKQAMFLLLFNRFVEVQDFAGDMLEFEKNTIDTHSWQSTIKAVQQQNEDALFDLICEVFPFETWEEVHEEFFKKGNT